MTLPGTLYASLTDPTAHPVSDVLACLHAESARSQVKGGWLWAPHVLTPGTGRSAAGVALVTALVYDCDDGPAPRDLNLAGWVHPTHTAGRERLILAISRPITPAEHTRVWPAFAGGYADRQCSDASRAFYLPPAGAPVWRLAGVVIDVDAVLAAAPAPDIAPQLPTAPGAGVCTQAQAEAVIAALVAAYPVKGQRHAYRLAAAGACAEAGITPELAHALLLDATRAVGGQEHDVAGVVRSSYAPGRLLQRAGTLVRDYPGAVTAVRALEAIARPAMPVAPTTEHSVGQDQPTPAAEPPVKPPFDMVSQAGDWVAWMNSQFTVLTALGASGKVRVGSWIRDASSVHPRRALALQSKDDFLLRMLPVTGFIEGKKDKNGAPERTQIAAWWLQRFDRAEATRFCFRPDLPPAAQINGQVNLWQGYGITPAPGDWGMLREHLRAYVARGDQEHFTYILRWMAWVVQNPGLRAEIVLVFKGLKGSGKNTAFDTLCLMLGQHGKAVANPKHFTGNFNAHLQDCALLFANEAIPPNDKAAEGVLKALVTDASMPIERKGVDVEHAPNCLSICMASNERWCVPASLDERRFTVFEIDPAGVRDPEYWAELHGQLDAGGRAAMLHDLLALDLTGWHPRKRPPKTAALVEQQVHGLRGADAVVYDMLASGIARGVLPDTRCSRPDGSVFICTRRLCEDLRDRSVNDTQLGRALARVGTQDRLLVIDRVRGYWMPPLAQARAVWGTSMGLAPAWDPDDGWSVG